MGLVVPENVERFVVAHRSETTSAATYAASCEFDLEALKGWLIEGDVLDIGCGLGGFSALMAKHCKGKLHLLDGTGWTSGRRVGFGPYLEPYNDCAATESLLEANGIVDYHWWPIGATELPPVTVVTSMLSWGWHYPVSTYLAAVEKALPVGGRLILDVRPDEGQEKVLEQSFELIGRPQGFGKCNKMVWQRA